MCCKRQGQHSVCNNVSPRPYIFLKNYVEGEEVKLDEQGDEKGLFPFLPGQWILILALSLYQQGPKQYNQALKNSRRLWVCVCVCGGGPGSCRSLGDPKVKSQRKQMNEPSVAKY